MNYRVNKKRTIIILFIVLTIIMINVYYFIFNIYDIKISSSKEYVFADPSSEIKLSITPINALGWEILFRTVSGKFKIIDGGFLVNILHKDEEKGFILLSPKGVAGYVEFNIESQYSLFPIYFKINILPKTT